jgi:two-component system chemotaxis response regulator CheB
VGERPRFEAVALVASLGGLDAVRSVLVALPADFPAAVVVVQHGRRSTEDPDRLARVLQRSTALPVRTATSGLALAPGVTVVPTGRTARLDADRCFVLGDEPAVSGGDVLLGTLATAVGPGAVAVVLTGMLHDGAEGVRAVKRAGGRVLVQDPATAAAGGMPSSAIATGCVDFVLPLPRLGPALVALAMAPGGADLLTVPTPSWARLHD